MKSELTNEMINSIEVLENLKDRFETSAIDYVINSIKEAIKSMGERSNYVNDSYLYNLNRTRIVLRILIDVNSFNKNDEEFKKHLNKLSLKFSRQKGDARSLNLDEEENEKNIRR